VDEVLPAPRLIVLGLPHPMVLRFFPAGDRDDRAPRSS
jgi:hypothetical protein